VNETIKFCFANILQHSEKTEFFVRESLRVANFVSKSMDVPVYTDQGLLLSREPAETESQISCSQK
jgi:hypothetical protein